MSENEETPSVKDTITKLVEEDKYSEAKAKADTLENGVIDDDGNTLYHEAVTRQNNKLLR